MQDLNKPLLRHNQREILQQEIERMERTGRAGDGRVDNPALSYQIRKTKQQLEEQSPHPLTGTEKDVLAKMERELREEIVNGMPTQEEMRRAPGVEYRHRRWEQTNKQRILRWKNIRLQLDPTSDDPDLANIERYRPRGGPAQSFMADALIPGHIAMSEQGKENWPLGEATVDTALKQATRRANGSGKPKRQLSPEAKAKLAANLAKGRATQAAKRATALTGAASGA